MLIPKNVLLATPHVIIRGSAAADVRQVQEWLCWHHTIDQFCPAVKIDGQYSDATIRAVQIFQTAVGYPQTGDVDPVTFDRLVEPMTKVLLSPFPGLDLQDPQGQVSFGDAIVAYAKQHLLQHPQEVGGQNRGPWVRLYMDGHEGDGWPWCMEGEIEILTENGWIKFQDLSADHGKVAQVDPDTLTVSFVRPTRYIRKNFDGRLAHIKARGMDVVVDQDHRFIGKWNNDKNEIRPIRDIRGELTIPSCRTFLEDNSLYSDIDLDLIAAFVADGFFIKKKTRLAFQVSRPRKIAALTTLGPISNMLRQPHGRERLPSRVFTFHVPKWFGKVFVDYKIFDWTWVLSLSARQAKWFIERYAFWDGSMPRRGSVSTTITTTRKQNWDVFTALGALGGLILSAKRRESNSGFSKHKKYIYGLTFSPTKKAKSIKAKMVSWTSGEKTLYCVTVPKGLILVRDKQGNPFVTGNCAGFAGFCWKQAAELLNHRPFEISFSCTAMAIQARQAGRFVQGNGHKPNVPHGSLFVRRKGGSTSAWDHTGIVTELHDSTFETIEGNTNDEGSREGFEVCKRIRSYRDVDFISAVW